MSLRKFFCAALIIVAAPMLCSAELTIASFAYSENVVFCTALEVLGWDPNELDFEEPSAAGLLDPQEVMKTIADTAIALGLEAKWVDRADNALDLSSGPILFTRHDASLRERNARREAYAKDVDPNKRFGGIPGPDGSFLIAIAEDVERDQVYLKYGGIQGNWFDRQKAIEQLPGIGLRISGRAPSPGAKIWNDNGVSRASVAEPESELTLFNVGSESLRFLNTKKSNAAIQIGLPEAALLPGSVARIPIHVTIDPKSNSGFIGAVSLAVANSPDLLANFTVFENIDKAREEHLESVRKFL